MKAKNLFAALLVSGVVSGVGADAGLADGPKGRQGAKASVQKRNQPIPTAKAKVGTLRAPTQAKRDAVPVGNKVVTQGRRSPVETAKTANTKNLSAQFPVNAGAWRKLQDQTAVSKPGGGVTTTGGMTDQEIDKMIKFKNCIEAEVRTYDKDGKLTKVAPILNMACVQGGPSVGGNSNTTTEDNNAGGDQSSGSDSGKSSSGSGSGSGASGGASGSSSGSGASGSSSTTASRSGRPSRFEKNGTNLPLEEREVFVAKSGSSGQPTLSSERGVYDENAGSPSHGDGKLGPRTPLHNEGSEKEPCMFHVDNHEDGSRTEYWIYPGQTYYDVNCPPEQTTPPENTPPSDGGNSNGGWFSKLKSWVSGGSKKESKDKDE